MSEEEEDDFEEEVLPDLPAVVATLEDCMKDFIETDDYSKLTKADLAKNIYNLMDLTHDLAKYVIAKSYAIDLLDRAVAHLTTEKYGNTTDSEQEDVQARVEQSLRHYIQDHYA